MLGAVVGDIVGSGYKYKKVADRDFALYSKDSHFTAGMVLMSAVANALFAYCLQRSEEAFQKALKKEYQEMMDRYSHQNYDDMLVSWRSSGIKANNENVSVAVRSIPVGFLASNLAVAETLSQITAEITHDNAEAIRGAKAISAAIFLARREHSKQAIQRYITEKYYDLSIEPQLELFHAFETSCSNYVPVAIKICLAAANFEEALRTAVCLGGHSSSLCALVGAVAEPLFDNIHDHGILYDTYRPMSDYLPRDLFWSYRNFRGKCHAKLKPFDDAVSSKLEKYPGIFVEFEDDGIERQHELKIFHNCRGRDGARFTLRLMATKYSDLIDESEMIEIEEDAFSWLSPLICGLIPDFDRYDLYNPCKKQTLEKAYEKAVKTKIDLEKGVVTDLLKTSLTHCDISVFRNENNLELYEETADGWKRNDAVFWQTIFDNAHIIADFYDAFFWYFTEYLCWNGCTAVLNIEGY